MQSLSASFARSMDSLEPITRFIGTFSDDAGLDEKTVFSVNLVVEELFTNAVKYVKNNPRPVSIALALKDSCLEIVITDTDVEPYDIRMREPYDFTKKIEERKVGGLGIPLINKLMDEVDYCYEKRRSTITLKKYLEKPHVSNNRRRKSCDA